MSARRIKKRLLIPLLLIGLACAGLFGPPVVFLAKVWYLDAREQPPFPSPGTSDASRLSAAQPIEVIAVASERTEAERQLVALLRRAVDQNLRISISGARHSMGGHTLYPGGIALDMAGLNHMALDPDARLLTVGAGARWSEIIPYLDRHGFAVAVMQSNNDFSVGGSLSVNCHGWQNDSPPISSTVNSFRLLTASGDILRCSRVENTELFSLALGGYGLFGVILDAELRVVPNEFYVAEPHRIDSLDYARAYRALTQNRSDIGMAYGRLNVSPDRFMEQGIITLLKRENTGHPIVSTLTKEAQPFINRLVFRGSVASDYGKNLRWKLERLLGQNPREALSRNHLMNAPSAFYATRDPASTDILHEYFIPAERLADFINKSRLVLKSHRQDLLNITVRNVRQDTDTFLHYAPEEVFGVVMFFEQRRTDEAEVAMRALARELIDVALSCNGRYYLPYRPHATQPQFARAYPQAEDFFALKRRYDPHGVFQNSFSTTYGNFAAPPGR